MQRRHVLDCKTGWRAVSFDASLFVRFEIIAPGRVILRRRFASAGFLGRTATSGAVSRFLSSAMAVAASSLLFAEEPLLEQASSCDVHGLESLFVRSPPIVGVGMVGAVTDQVPFASRSAARTPAARMASDSARCGVVRAS